MFLHDHNGKSQHLTPFPLQRAKKSGHQRTRGGIESV